MYCDEILKAAHLLALEDQPLKTASRICHVPVCNLIRHRDNGVAGRGALVLGPLTTAPPAVTESILRDHSLYMEKHRRLAYYLAEKWGVKHNFSESLMTDASCETFGYCSCIGWTDPGLCLRWLEHFVNFTKEL